MRAVDIIEKKRDGQPLSADEICFFLDSYLHNLIPDYQVSAFCMAVYFQGMTRGELKIFTEQMMLSGDQLSFEGVNRYLVDKHSTGGVGDKTTIALAPILACFGIGTAKLSGRGLGHTGGTVDKFESIPGFTFPENKEKFAALVNSTGIGIMSYSDTIVPLDKMLYSLRDVTATVPSIPLIASSIMSKKLAVAADAIILDVKVGSGAFMRELESARELALTMVEIGRDFGRKVGAVLTNMDEPLGRAVGNSLELIEAIETLQGKGPADFTELVSTLGSMVLMQKGEAESMEEALLLIEGAIDSGDALEYLKSFVTGCGGDPKTVDDPLSVLPLANHVYELPAREEGYILSIDAAKIGHAAMVLGAGRAAKGDAIDHGVGLVMEKKTGDHVKAGEGLVQIYYEDEKKCDEAIRLINSAVQYSDTKADKQSTILEILDF